MKIVYAVVRSVGLVLALQWSGPPNIHGVTHPNDSAERKIIKNQDHAPRNGTQSGGGLA